MSKKRCSRNEKGGLFTDLERRARSVKTATPMYKLVDRHETPPANEHDRQPFTRLVDPDVERAHSDSTCKSAEHDEFLREAGIENGIHEKGVRGRPLTVAKRANRSRSRVRARVEHVFAFMAGVIKADGIRTIGIQRAKRTNTLMNSVYNLARIVHLGLAM